MLITNKTFPYKRNNSKTFKSYTGILIVSKLILDSGHKNPSLH